MRLGRGHGNFVMGSEIYLLALFDTSCRPWCQTPLERQPPRTRQPPQDDSLACFFGGANPLSRLVGGGKTCGERKRGMFLPLCLSVVPKLTPNASPQALPGGLPRGGVRTHPELFFKGPRGPEKKNPGAILGLMPHNLLYAAAPTHQEAGACIESCIALGQRRRGPRHGPASSCSREGAGGLPGTPGRPLPVRGSRGADPTRPKPIRALSAQGGVRRSGSTAEGGLGGWGVQSFVPPWPYRQGPQNPVGRHPLPSPRKPPGGPPGDTVLGPIWAPHFFESLGCKRGGDPLTHSQTLFPPRGGRKVPGH